MRRFASDGLELAYLDEGERHGTAVVLIHGFASNAHVNWVHPGWVKTLTDAGYRAIAFDHRGHGISDKPHEPADYAPEKMVADVASLMDHCGVERAHLLGYSMGARVSAFFGLTHPERARSLVLGGLGGGLIDGVGNWDPIADALLADSLDDVSDERGRMFRKFADQTKSDRVALAACIRTSRDTLTASAVARLPMPVLVAVGTKDEIGGSAGRLAEFIPQGRALDIPNRDHMLAVGDKLFKAAVLDFYCELDGA